MNDASLSVVPKTGLADLKENFRSELLPGFLVFDCIAAVLRGIDGCRFDCAGLCLLSKRSVVERIFVWPG